MRADPITAEEARCILSAVAALSRAGIRPGRMVTTSNATVEQSVDGVITVLRWFEGNRELRFLSWVEFRDYFEER